MQQDSLNAWYDGKKYRIRHLGKTKGFNSYIEAKEHIDNIMKSVFFSTPQLTV